jgi:hypothetical protein
MTRQFDNGIYRMNRYLLFGFIALLATAAGCGGNSGVDTSVLKKYEGIYLRTQGPGPNDFYVQFRMPGEPLIRADVPAELHDVNQGWVCDDGFFDRICLRNDYDGKLLHYRKIKGIGLTRDLQNLLIDFSQFPVMKVIDYSNSTSAYYTWRGMW